MRTSLLAGLALVCTGILYAPNVLPGPTPGAGAAVAEGSYKEAFCYSAVVRPNYVPAYTPHASSLFENPREYPAALCVLATPYHKYGGIPGWFFGSPRGYQSSVPPGSHVLAYNRGELGITEKLSFGYPEGMRVVERVLVPYQPYCRPGGFLISAGENPLMVIDSNALAGGGAPAGPGPQLGKGGPAPVRVARPLPPPEK